MIVVVCVCFCGFWRVTLAGGVREDFDGFEVWAWGFPRYAYVIGYVWFGIVGGVRGVGASMS